MTGFMRCHRVLLATMLVGLALRAALLLYYLTTHGWQGEVWEYEAIALNLVEGRGFLLDGGGCDYRSYVMPLFPMLCAFLHRAWGPGLGLFYAFHLLVGCGVIFLAWLLARRWLGEDTAALAAALVAIEPGLIVYQSYKVDPNALAVLFLLGGLCLLFGLMGAPATRPAVYAGILMGAGMMTRPDLVAFLAAPVVWMGSAFNRAGVKKAGLAVLASACLMLTPWVLRNARIHGRLVLFTTQTDWGFWVGNHPLSEGAMSASDGWVMLDAGPEDFRAKVLSADELGRSDLFQEDFMRRVSERPGEFFSGVARKFWRFWWFSPAFGSYYDWIRPWMLACYKLLHSALIGLAVMGLALVFRRGDEDQKQKTFCCLGVVLALAIVHSLFYVETRHRLLVMPLLLMFSARGLEAVLDRLGLGVRA